jgi:hypothetical protein
MQSGLNGDPFGQHQDSRESNTKSWLWSGLVTSSKGLLTLQRQHQAASPHQMLACGCVFSASQTWHVSSDLEELHHVSSVS